MTSAIGPRRQLAVVLGGSIAGLLAARVLSQHYDRVVIVERDPVTDEPMIRKGQAHGRHVHGLLTNGLEVMEQYFPDLAPRLQAAGALILDFGTALRWHAAGDYRVRFLSGLRATFVSRAHLEWEIRRSVLALSNVELRQETAAHGLLVAADRRSLSGVLVTQVGGTEEHLPADLVVDATGRGSRTPGWLTDLGFQPPAEQSVQVGVRYTSRIYRRSEGDLTHAAAVLISPVPPQLNRLGALFPLERDRWIASIAAWGGEGVPRDKDEFLDIAASLPAPEMVRTMLRLEAEGDLFHHHFPANRRYHYERLKRPLAGLLAIGDSICTFNPAYGQGMTVAARQAVVLDQVLSDSNVSPDSLARCYFRRVAKLIEVPWKLALCEDFRFPTTRGKPPWSVRPLNAYVSAVQRATHHDPHVYRAFLKVLNLLAPPSHLFHPRILARVLWAAFGWPKRPPESPGPESPGPELPGQESPHHPPRHHEPLDQVRTNHEPSMSVKHAKLSGGAVSSEAE